MPAERFPEHSRKDQALFQYGGALRTARENANAFQANKQRIPTSF
jgi:hypothetical protein